MHENIALYGYPGKKSAMEISELKNIKLQESPGFFKIFALHTCISDAVKTLPIDSVKENELPEADYYALGHLHIDYAKEEITVELLDSMVPIPITVRGEQVRIIKRKIEDDNNKEKKE